MIALVTHSSVPLFFHFCLLLELLQGKSQAGFHSPLQYLTQISVSIQLSISMPPGKAYLETRTGPGAVKGQAVSTRVDWAREQELGPDHVGKAGCIEGVVISPLSQDTTLEEDPVPWKQRGGRLTTGPSREVLIHKEGGRRGQ